MRRALDALILAALMAAGCQEGSIHGDPDGADGAQAGEDGGGGGDEPAPGDETGPVDETDPGDEASPGDETSPGDEVGPTDGGDQTPAGQLSGIFRVDHFGWRPSDRKQAVLLGHAGETVELRRLDGGLAATFTAGTLETDEDSGDAVSVVDFSSHSEPGSYYLSLPGAGLRSYPFEIGAGVYDVVAAAAAKSFYFQRCNHDKALPWAGDALAGFPGLGGRWVDGSCHEADRAAPPGPGSADHGPLDVHGGWHDAGDYQKTLWGRGVVELLFAYEVHPALWTDGQLDLPESGNGVPDLLDEAAWELDFYVRLQRPDGHFMSSVKGRDATINSPPSASDEGRVYFDCTSPDGDGWSGGGVTLAQATGNAVLALAHAALVFHAAGQTARADAYRAAALAGWAWLDGQATSSTGERRAKAAAAAAVFRLDPTQATARDHADAFAWSTWDGQLPWSATPADGVLAAGAWHYLANPAGTPAVQAAIRDAALQVFVEGTFGQAGPYGGMYGGPADGWDWSWGSNRAQGFYGANLMMAARFGILGGRTRAEVESLAARYFHYLLGLNPLHMVYLTNMAAYGGEHSSFQIYHAWFSYQGGDGDHGNPDYNGKPASVDEPLYPYHPDDDQTSRYGPAPGLVPGGPNWYYSCAYDLQGANPPYAYRDFSVSCDWDGGQCRACSWEITEPMCAYQGPLVLLASFMTRRP